MPTIRYHIRSEYGLADPELHAAADRDDPEAILEGVAMAGLVGVLRQLGDLAEFAAEIFHELHEEVMSTSARGHALVLRVQQLEAEFPSIEKALFSQSNHSTFAYNDGIDWHTNIRMDQNLVTRGDMPRFVLDSYEECRGPPRLFMLDKFDTAGAGACLKRYSDPSFFKIDLSSSGREEVNIQKEKKPRKIKKKGSRWKIGQTLESLLSPRGDSSLQPIASVQIKGKAVTRVVRLKPRRLRHIDRSLIERLLELHSDVQKVVFNNSRNYLNGKVMPIDYTDPASEIHDIIFDKSANMSLLGEENIPTSPNRGNSKLEKVEREDWKREDDAGLQHQHAREAHETDKSLHINEAEENLADCKTKMGEFINEYELSDLEKTSAVWMMDQKLVHPEATVEGSGDGYKSDDISSEQDNFSDALYSIESEGETDYENKNKPDADILNKEIYSMDADFNEGVDQSSETNYTHKSINSNLPSAVKNDTSTWPNSDAYSTISTTGAVQEGFVAHADTESFLGETNGKNSDWSRIEVSNSVDMDSTKLWKIEVSNSVDMDSTESSKTQLFAGPVIRPKLGSHDINGSFLKEPQPAELVGELMSEDASEVIEMPTHHSPPTNISISIEDPLHQDSTTQMTMPAFRETQESIKQDREVFIGEGSILPDMPSFSGEISVTAIQHSGTAAYMQNDVQPNELLEISSHDMIADNATRKFHGLSYGKENERVSENLYTEWHSPLLIAKDTAVKLDSLDDLSEGKDEIISRRILFGDNEDSAFLSITQLGESQNLLDQDLNSCLIGELTPDIPPTTLVTTDFLNIQERVREGTENDSPDEFLPGHEKNDEMAKSSIEELKNFDQEQNSSLNGELKIPALTLGTSNFPGWDDNSEEEKGNNIDNDNLIYHRPVVSPEDTDELAKSETQESEELDQEESLTRELKNPLLALETPVWLDILQEKKKIAIDSDDLSYSRSVLGLECTMEIIESPSEESQNFDQEKKLISVQKLENLLSTLNIDDVSLLHESMKEEKGNAVDGDDLFYCRSAVSLEGTNELAKDRNDMPYFPSECIGCSDVRELPNLDKMDSEELVQSHSGTTMFLENEQLHNHSYDSESIGSAVSLTDNFKYADDYTGDTLEDKEGFEQNLHLNKFASINVVDTEKLARSDVVPSSSYSPDISCSRGQLEEEPEFIPGSSYQVDLDIHENFTDLKISSSSKYTDFMNDTCSSVEEPSSENAIPKAVLVSEELSDKDDLESHEHFSPSKNYLGDLDTHQDFTAMKIASSGKDMNATCSSVEEPSSENAISKSGLVSEALSDEDHVEMHEQFSLPKVDSMVTNVMDDTSSGEVTLSDNTAPKSGLLSEELSDNDDLKIHEQFSPTKTALLDTESMDDTSSVEEPSADHTVHKFSLLSQELYEKDTGLFMDLDRTQFKLDDGIDQTSPEYYFEKEKATSQNDLLLDRHDNEKEELFLFSDAISNTSTAPQLMHLNYQASKEENVTSSTEVDEHDILGKVSGITTKSLGEEPNAHSHSSGSNFKLSDFHSSSFDRDMAGKFNSGVFALSVSSPEHSASSLSSNVSPKPSPPFPNFVFAYDKSEIQLSHTKEVDELSTSFSLQDLGESPPLPPLPPLQWRTGKSKEKPLLSDANATQQLTATSLPPPFAEKPLLSDANTTIQLTGTSLPHTLAESGTKPESDLLAAGNNMDQQVNPLRMPDVQSTRFQSGFFEREVYPSLSESPPVLDNAKCQVSDPSTEGDPSVESSNVSPLEHENIQYVLEDEVSNHPAPLKREITPSESGFQSEESPRLELERYHDSDHGSLNEDKDMNQPEISFTGGLASNDKKHKEISGDNGAYLKLSEPPPTSVIEIPHPGYLAMMNEDKFTQYGAIWTPEDGRPNIRPLSVRNWPRNPLMDAVAAHDRNTLRKVSDLAQPLDKQKTEQINLLLDQIRNKAFSLKPVAVLRQNIKGTHTNLKVAAILEKANAIRQACAGSDEDDGDSWSDS